MDLSNVHSAAALLPRTDVPSRVPGFPFGLGASGVHELAEGSFGDMPALTGLALAASHALRPGPIIWISQRGLAREHGLLQQRQLEAFHGRERPCLFVRPCKLVDTLWAIEEAIRSSAVTAVIAEIDEADFTASRRLTLAASRHGVPLTLLMPHTREGSTAATARWRVSPLPSAVNRFDPRAPGRPRWRAVLERSRNVPYLAGHIFDLEHDHETLSLNLVSRMATRPAAPRPASGEQTQKWQRTG
ncbi:MAG: hypothetical protein AAF950_13595 [Pseudomonadota bacterium]